MGFPGKHDCDDFRSLVVTGIVRRVLMADDATVNGLSVPPIPEAAQWRMLKCGPLAAADSRIDVTGQYVNDPRLLDYAIDLAATSGDYGILVCFQESMGRFPTVIEAARASWIERKRADPVNHFAVSGFCTENYTRDLEAIEISVYEEVKFATHALASSRVSRGPSGSGVVTRPSQPLHRSLRASSTSSPLRISSPSASRPCPSATPGPPESEAADVAVTPPRLPAVLTQGTLGGHPPQREKLGAAASASPTTAPPPRRPSTRSPPPVVPRNRRPRATVASSHP